MPSQNEKAVNLKIGLLPRLAGKLVLSQIQNSVLSKKGKTTLTGIFEGTPQNTVVNQRGFTAPGQGTAPKPKAIERAANIQARTYLESLKK